jgi:hypothetical protein
MKPMLAALCIAAVLALPSVALATETIATPPALGQLPTIDAQNLNERALRLPQDLPAEKTLVLIAFERQQQANLDTWIAGLQLNRSPMPWIETPVIDPKNAFVRGFIDSGMRRGIPDTAARERTITLYTDRAAFSKAMGLRDPFKNVYLAVVERSGRVLLLVEGDYSAEKAKLLLQAMAPPAAK